MENFGKIKNTFNNIIVEGIAKKDDDKKRLFKKYLKIIKNDKILKEQFMVFTNIENKVETNENKATEFVKSNIEILKKYKKKDIIEANNKLINILGNRDYPLSDDLNKLYENINTLILTKKTPKTIDNIVESLSYVVEYIKNNKPKEIVSETNIVPLSILTDIAVDKFNEKYSTLNEDEKKVLKTIIESDEQSKKDILKKYTIECVDLVNGLLKESNGDIKEKLLETKDKLLRLEYNKESFITDISKLIELKTDLG